MKKILSTRKVGLNYEKLVLAVLESYSFQLKHTGGTGDGGQDFTGCWRLPQRNIPVIGQCKCWKTTVGPKEVREFEDVLYRNFVRLSRGAPLPSLVGQRVASHVGLMISRSWFSTSSLKTLHSSKMAMIFMQILEANTVSKTELGSNCNDADSDTDLEPNITPDLNPGPEPYWQDRYPDTKSTPTINHSDLTSHTAPCDSHMTGVTRSGNSPQGVVGYVNEIALNCKALEAMGDMQLTWKWVTGQQPESCQSWRQLVLTLKDTT